MKLSQIFGLVVLFHLGVVAILLIQPGCQTQKAPAPDPAMTAPAGTAARTAPGTAAPSRPVATPSGQLDPAFNAGFEPSAPRTTPMRPVAQTTPAPTTRTDAAPGGVLRPLTPLDPAPIPAPAATSQTYTVQRGDNLTVIARRFDVGLNDLLAANNLRRDSTIYAGQELRIPATEPAHTAAAPSPAATGATIRYTVQAGDTLTRIANRFDVSVAEIRQANNLSSDTIRIGQELRIPEVAGAPRPAAPPPSAPAPRTAAPAPGGTVTYTVQAGDTPGGIARRFGISAEELMRANNITDPRRLFVGRELIIPGQTATPATTPRATPAPAPQTRATTPDSVPLRPQPSTPARITQPPIDVLDALDDEDLPFVDVEDLPPPRNN